MRIVFMGTGDICLPTLRWLLEQKGNHPVVGVYTQPDKPVGRKQILTAPEVKTLALAAGVPVFQPEILRKNEDALASLRELAPDLIVVMAYGQLLPRTVIDLPGIACVNLHASLLPRHRGASPIQAAIREGDSETGITLMHIAPKLDAGDVIFDESISIRSNDTGGTLHDRLAELGPMVIQRGVEHFQNETATSQPQEDALATHCGKLGRDDGFVDWTADAKEIERVIRAYDPWPGTHTTLESDGRILKMKLFPPVTVGPDINSPPGSHIVENGILSISCGTGSISLGGEVQLEGRKRMPTTELLRGFGIPDGTLFGNP